MHLKKLELSACMKTCLLKMAARRKCEWSDEKGRNHWNVTGELGFNLNTLYALETRGLVEYERGFLYPEDEKYGVYVDKWRLTELGIKAAEAV